MVHNVKSGADLKQATEELNQFSKGLMGMILGMIAPKVSSRSKRFTTHLFFISAWDGNRTRTPLAGLRILRSETQNR